MGLVPEAEFTTASIQLETDDTLVLFSDGVTEAMDPEENLFGVSSLQSILDGQHDTGLDRLQQTIVESVDRFTNGASQADDITLLLVRYRGAPVVRQDSNPL